jgi:hypothetical protein
MWISNLLYLILIVTRQIPSITVSLSNIFSMETNVENTPFEMSSLNATSKSVLQMIVNYEKHRCYEIFR